MVAVAAICLALGASACGSDDDNDSAAKKSSSGGKPLACKDGKILVGLAKAKSGGATFFEQAGANGVLVAVDEINANGGVKGCELETVAADTQSDPAGGAQAARSLLDKGVQILLVPDDFDLGVAAARVGQKAGVLTVSTAAGALLFGEAVGPLMVDGGITTRELGHSQGQFSLDQGYRKVFHVVDPGLAFFTEQDKYFDEKFEPGGGETVGKDDVDSLGGQSDFGSAISKIRSANPDVVTAQMIFPQVGTFVKQLRAAGLDTPVVNGTTLGTPELVKLVGKDGLKDVYWATQVYYEGAGTDPKIDPEIQKFTEAYKAKVGKPVDQSNRRTPTNPFWRSPRRSTATRSPTPSPRLTRSRPRRISKSQAAPSSGGRRVTRYGTHPSSASTTMGTSS